jgi:hypothetical protein
MHASATAIDIVLLAATIQPLYQGWESLVRAAVDAAAGKFPVLSAPVLSVIQEVRSLWRALVIAAAKESPTTEASKAKPKHDGPQTGTEFEVKAQLHRSVGRSLNRDLVILSKQWCLSVS